MKTNSRGWRRSARRTTWPQKVGWLVTRSGRRTVAIVVAALLTVYVGYRAYDFNESLEYYADEAVGDPRAIVLYGLGDPRATASRDGRSAPLVGPASANRDPVWRYAGSTGGQVDIVFDPRDDRVTTIACSQPDAQPFACPHLFQLGLGTIEERIYWKLGKPTSESVAGQVKVMHYADIGASYHLKRYTVFKIVLHRNKGSLSGILWRFAHGLLP